LFLKIAKSNGYEVTGVEPNPVMAQLARTQNLNVLEGLFPDVLVKENKFDFIIFNDVFEHIEDLDSILSSVHHHLNKAGKLIINIPNSNGFIYRLPSILAKIGYKTPWDRLWQTMFYTPHLHFFNPENLKNYLKSYNFELSVKPVNLDTINTSKLWKRLSLDISTTKLEKICQFITITILSPFLKILPADAFVIIVEPSQV